MTKPDYYCKICDGKSYPNKKQFTEHFVRDHTLQNIVDYFWDEVTPFEDDPA